MAAVKDILTNNDFLVKQNSTRLDRYIELAEYALPRKAWINSMHTRGEKLKFNFLYDSTAIQSLQIMVAGIHSNLTNPASRWFDFRARDGVIMQSYAVKMWFRDVVDALYSAIGDSNFDATAQGFYEDAGCFGTGVFMLLEDYKTDFRYESVPVDQVQMVEDAHGNLIQVYRNFKLTAMQAYAEWGNDAGKTVLENHIQKPHMEVEFLHYVGPRFVRDISKKDAVNMPFESIWIAKKDQHVMKESGFEEMPYFRGKFYEDEGDPFGYSPLDHAIADVKGINTQKKTIIRAAMKAADPALIAPFRGFALPLNLNPAAMNYYDPSKTTADALQALGGNVHANFPVTIELLKLTKDDIENAFFVKLFRSITDITKQMTIPEIQRRISESMVLMGPVVGRFTGKAIGPSLIRAFNIMYRNGRLPQAPQELINQHYDVVYLSPLAKAQRMSEMNSINAFLTAIGGIATVKPAVLDKFDEDNTADILAEIQGVDPRVLRNPKDVAAIRAQRAQEAARMTQLAGLEQGSKAAQGFAQAGKAHAEAQMAGAAQ